MLENISCLKYVMYIYLSRHGSGKGWKSQSPNKIRGIKFGGILMYLLLFMLRKSLSLSASA